MLSQLKQLGDVTDGRYATDDELKFIDHYARSFYLRVQTYQRLQVAEAMIVQQVLNRVKKLDPASFQQEHIEAKWKRDTIRVLRYSAIALLLDDPNTLRERLLYWFQTVMKAFGTQKNCAITYQVMQEVVQQLLTPNQASLFCPILELNRQILGGEMYKANSGAFRGI
jgi:hypothetical protein